MPKKKLQRFAENRSFPNMFFVPYEELQKGFALKSEWGKSFFKNSNPIILELACGKGEYTVGLAERYPHQNYIGLDIKGARMWRGCKTSNEKNLSNVAFLRTQIGLINYYFGEAEISGLWITFPDPQLKRINEKKRLTSPSFLRRYARLLRPEAIIRLKTDNPVLFDYTLDVIKQEGHNLICSTYDLYESDLVTDARDIQTHYEAIFRRMGIKIKYLEFTLNTGVYEG